MGVCFRVYSGGFRRLVSLCVPRSSRFIQNWNRVNFRLVSSSSSSSSSSCCCCCCSCSSYFLLIRYMCLFSLRFGGFQSGEVVDKSSHLDVPLLPSDPLTNTEDEKTASPGLPRCWLAYGRGHLYLRVSWLAVRFIANSCVFFSIFFFLFFFLLFFHFFLVLYLDLIYNLFFFNL